MQVMDSIKSYLGFAPPNYEENLRYLARKGGVSPFEESDLKDSANPSFYQRNIRVVSTLCGGLVGGIQADVMSVIAGFILPYIQSAESRRAITQIRASSITFCFTTILPVLGKDSNLGSFLSSLVKITMIPYYVIMSTLGLSDKRKANYAWYVTKTVDHIRSSPYFPVWIATGVCVGMLASFSSAKKESLQISRALVNKLEHKFQEMAKTLLALPREKAHFLAKGILKNQQELLGEIRSLKLKEISPQSRKSLISPLIQTAEKIVQVQKEELS